MTRNAPLAGALWCATCVFAAGASAQGRPPDLRITSEAGSVARVPVTTERGYAAVPATALAEVGWRVAVDGGGVRALGPGQVEVTLRPGTPFVRWNGRPLQLADPVYATGSRVMMPLQLLTDVIPDRMPGRYAFDGPALSLRIGERDLAPGEGPGAPRTEPGVEDKPEASGGRASAPRAAADGAPPAPPAAPPADPRPDTPPSDTAGQLRPVAYEGPRVVVVDPGHGGEDPGSIGRGGVREKHVALGIARAIAERLRNEPGVEVHLLREDDSFVPLWDRGPKATELKGERPGAFVSIHANSFNAPTRGFESYFLSEARTEHERRVAAIENAPLRSEAGRAFARGDDLDLILRELRNLDHQHWSALLAQLVQEELARVHPGPDRGVKQGPFAVITNALMPSVLVEIGYLSHVEEARLLGSADFQARAGRAIADAILRFFERYPPGAARSGGSGR